MNSKKLTYSLKLLEEIGISPLWIRRSNTIFVNHSSNKLHIKLYDKKMQVSSSIKQFNQNASPCTSENKLSDWLKKISHSSSLLPPVYIFNSLKTQKLLTQSNKTVLRNMSLDQLQNVVSKCQRCNLHVHRTNTVFGCGPQQAKWLFIGEGPGFYEDQCGQPFVGPAGKLLDNMLKAIGLQRNTNVYITNIVKCRPMINTTKTDRPPTSFEITSCMSYLEQQIALIQPSILIALGKTAAISLLKIDPTTPVSKLRGMVYRYYGVPLIVTYHPAYLLRQLNDKRKTWADLCLAMREFNSLVSSKKIS